MTNKEMISYMTGTLVTVSDQTALTQAQHVLTGLAATLERMCLSATEETVIISYEEELSA